jgi:hypothetical protein
VTARVRWSAGGEAEVVSLRADAIVLRSTVPSPPGSRLEGAMLGESPAARLKVKVHASRRRAEGDFVIEGRPIDLTRELREKILRDHHSQGR